MHSPSRRAVALVFTLAAVLSVCAAPLAGAAPKSSTTTRQAIVAPAEAFVNEPFVIEVTGWTPDVGLHVSADCPQSAGYFWNLKIDSNGYGLIASAFTQNQAGRCTFTAWQGKLSARARTTILPAP